MCHTPIKIDDDTFVSCRTCDACIAARRNTWTARAMAEKASAGHTFAVTLTYSDLPCGSRPHGARVFRYRDIQLWLKALRQAYVRKHGKAGGFRYIVCGERGSQGTERVHWHCILFTDHDLGVLGEWRHFPSGNIADQPIRMERNYNWSLWPHGHVKPQKPDTAGIHYAMKYAMADQFGAAKSKRKKRHRTSYNVAASMFRMSKLPPIGVPFLLSKLQRLEDLGAVPNSADIKVPNYKGYWFLQGDLREWFLLECRRINAAIREATGADAPQWSSLLQSVSKPNRDENEVNQDMEVLTYGEAWKPEPRPEADAIDADYKRRQGTAIGRVKHTINRCGSYLPCSACWAELDQRDGPTDEQVRQAVTTFFQWYHGPDREDLGPAAEYYHRAYDEANPHERAKIARDFALKHHHFVTGAASPWCRYRDTANNINAFAARKSVARFKRKP